MEVPNIICTGVKCRLRGALRQQRAPRRAFVFGCVCVAHTPAYNKGVCVANAKLFLVLLIALAQTGLASTYYPYGYGYGYAEAGDYGSESYEYFDFDYGYGYDPYGYDNEPDGRVEVQESPAEAVTSRFHYVVPISVAGDVVCAGWIYRDNLVVTAAHCLPEYLDLATLKVYVERYELAEDWHPSKTYGVTKAVSHPQYDPFTMKHDVAVLLLDGNAGATHFIQHANPANHLDIEDIEKDSHRYCGYSGCELALIGWGQPQKANRALTSYMQRGVVSFKENEECKADYSYFRDVSSDMVCTNAVTTADSCAGSGGAPLVLQDPGLGRDIIVGIFSWGESCATPGKPAVFASMSDAKPFIEQMSLDLV